MLNVNKASYLRKLVIVQHMVSLHVQIMIGIWKLIFDNNSTTPQDD